jgi:hypothetical protein
MIAARLLSAWDALVGATAFLAITVLAICLMAGVVKLGDAPRYLGTITCVVILLFMLPAIIIGLWKTMSFGQQLGVAVIGIAIIFLFSAAHRKSKNTRH